MSVDLNPEPVRSTITVVVRDPQHLKRKNTFPPGPYGLRELATALAEARAAVVDMVRPREVRPAELISLKQQKIVEDANKFYEEISSMSPPAQLIVFAGVNRDTCSAVSLTIDVKIYDLDEEVIDNQTTRLST